MPVPAEGDTPPPIVIPDSAMKASIVTVFSLVFFGITLAGAILKLGSAHDLNGIRALLMRDDTLGWLTTIAPFFWLGLRTARTWFKTKRINRVVDSVDDSIAIRKSEFDASPPTRAREPATPIRVLDASVLRGPTAPIVIAGVDVSRQEDRQVVSSDALMRAGGIDPDGPFDVGPFPSDMRQHPSDLVIPGDALSLPPPTPPVSPEPVGNTDEFDTVHAQWVALGEEGAFSDFLRWKGWENEGGRWRSPQQRHTALISSKES